MQPLRVESMSYEQLRSLALDGLADALTETMTGLSEVGREAISARVRLSNVKTSWLRKDAAYRSKDEYEATLEEAKAICDTLKLRASSLRELKSCLQTLVRAVN